MVVYPSGIQPSSRDPADSTHATHDRGFDQVSSATSVDKEWIIIRHDKTMLSNNILNKFNEVPLQHWVSVSFGSTVLQIFALRAPL